MGLIQLLNTLVDGHPHLQSQPRLSVRQDIQCLHHSNLRSPLIKILKHYLRDNLSALFLQRGQGHNHLSLPHIVEECSYRQQRVSKRVLKSLRSPIGSE